LRGRCNATIGLELAASHSLSGVSSFRPSPWLPPTLGNSLDLRLAMLIAPHPRSERAKITPETVEFWVHVLDGHAVEELSDLAWNHQLARFLTPPMHRVRMPVECGSFGDLEVFSFHATKFFNSFEGGAITTKNAELADRLRQMRNFGFADTDRVVSLGTNAKMSEISAAMALSSLEAIDEFIDVNRRNYLQYVQGLGSPGVTIVHTRAGTGNFQHVVGRSTQTAQARSRLAGEAPQGRRCIISAIFLPGAIRWNPTGQQLQAAIFPEPSGSPVCLQLPTGTAVSGA
jgi:hypothetical protein